ncbi:hypothetical protein MRS44_018547 [Fusarium solani]|uniref:uncharacterized protein n=1 Tax=Fusarium solani TaxID=169388 RepID=UPI0032C46252|nr:hypothetical protein MRS44_018547 [Fusarium solani]
MVTDGMAKQRREKRKLKSESDIFIVDSIQEHVMDENFNIVLSQGNTKFRVKWQGYEAEKDWTWEPLENLRISGEEIIRDYFDRLAGKPSGMKESRTAVRTKRHESAGGHVPRASSRRLGLSLPVSKKLKWRPPVGSWEDHIQTIDGCEDAGNGDLVVYATWKGGEKTRHKAQMLHTKCPQKVHFLATCQMPSFANRSSCFVSTSVLWCFHDHETQRRHAGFFQSASPSLCLHTEKAILPLRLPRLLSHSRIGIIWDGLPALAAQASRVRTSPLRGGREFGILRDSYNTTTPAFHVSDHLST